MFTDRSKEIVLSIDKIIMPSKTKDVTIVVGTVVPVVVIVVVIVVIIVRKCKSDKTVNILSRV